MSEQLPAPDFDAQQYARPNQNWICGHACEGNACRIGPDKKGNCRATAECKPILKISTGETKGRWHCTRSGGECESGPLPDGSCCHPIAKCSPVPTLRVWRGRTTLAVVTTSFAALLILLGNPSWRNNFISPGEISLPHSGAAFAALAAGTNGGTGLSPVNLDPPAQAARGLKANCGACHVAGNAGPNQLLHAALNAEPGIFNLKKLLKDHHPGPTAIDESCLQCHAGKNFHQPDAAVISCAFCHAEHQGKMMAATTDANCSFCHGDVAKLIRPKAEGGNFTIHHFAENHPQFRFITEKLRDPDTLKFDHALHLTGPTIPNLPDGEKISCAFCHQPDAVGAFMKPVAFENNCRVCHSLQFDPETPQLTLPHGDATLVAAFLRSLPKQFSDLASREKISDATGFSEKKLAGLRTQFGGGEELERRVFFSTATLGPEARIGTLSGTTRAIFPGCALCHEVKTTAAGAPQITKPVQPQRWLARAKFSHAKHAGMVCTECHAATGSKDTADILLPARENCVTCHSPRGGVANSCTECHSFHQPRPVAR